VNPVGTFVVYLAFLLQSGASIQSGPITQKAESRDCALNVANVTGNVTVINCPGVPAKAIERLSRELTARRLSESKARQEAEDYRQKYEALQATMASAGLSQALLQKASSYLAQGDLTQASKVLDEALEQEGPQVMQAATTHYYRARVAELSFDTKTEAEHLEAAYRLAPQSAEIANAYGIFLIQHGRPAEAELVFKRRLNETTKPEDVAGTLVNMASSLRFQGKLSEAKEKFLEAASLWDACSKQHVQNSIHNETVAVDGAADIAFAQQDFEEAKELYERAIALGKISVRQSSDPYTGALFRLDLSRYLLSLGRAYEITGDLDSAFSSCEDAAKIAKEPTVLGLSNHAKSIVGEAKTLECTITAQRGNPVLAQTFCDEALDTLDLIEDAEGGEFKGEVASALFARGLVQEDIHRWSQALLSFTQAAALLDDLLKNGQAQFTVAEANAVLHAMGAALNSGDKGAAVENARHAVSLTDDLSPDLIDFHTQVLKESADVLDKLGHHGEAAEILRKRDSLGPAPTQ